MKRFLSLLGMLSTALAVFVPMSSAQASWVSDHCNTTNYEDSNYRRVDAQAYAAVGEGEGYEWGGGCWNDNDRDDTPDKPDSSGEGPDCSGFTFKTWELKATYGKDGWRFWDKLSDKHGPYAAADYRYGGNNDPENPFRTMTNKSNMIYMDAFASTSHIGMLYTLSGSTANTDTVVEALGDSYGIGIWTEDYRADGAYYPIRRKDWTQDCYPRCTLLDRARTVSVS